MEYLFSAESHERYERDIHHIFPAPHGTYVLGSIGDCPQAEMHFFNKYGDFVWTRIGRYQNNYMDAWMSKDSTTVFFTGLWAESDDHPLPEDGPFVAAYDILNDTIFNIDRVEGMNLYHSMGPRPRPVHIAYYQDSMPVISYDNVLLFYTDSAAFTARQYYIFWY